MKKSRIILFLLLIATFSTFIFSKNDNKINASSNLFDFYFQVGNNNQDPSMEDLKAQFNSYTGSYIIKFMVNANTSNSNIGALQIELLYNTDLFEINSIRGLFGEPGEFAINPYHQISRGTVNKNEVLLALKPDFSHDKFILPAGPTALFEILLKPKVEIDTIEGFNMNVKMKEDGAFGTVLGEAYTEEQYTFRDLTIGELNAVSDSTLESLTINGKSKENASYEESKNGLVDPLKTLKISYQDSIKGLNIDAIKTKASATLLVEEQKSGPNNTYVTGDKIVITVSDDGVPATVYTRTIEVDLGDPDTTLEVTTNKSAQGAVVTINDSTINDSTINIKMPYSVTDLTITAKALHEYAFIKGKNPGQPFTLTKTGILEGSNTLAETIIVVAEDGTEKKYTIILERVSGKNDTDINVTVNDTELDSTADRFGYTISENDNGFSFSVNPNDPNAKLKYKEDGAFITLLPNQKITNNTIGKGTTVIYEIEVTPEKGAAKIYYLDVTRENSTNVELGKLEIIEGLQAILSIPFLDGKYTYRLKNADSLKYLLKASQKLNEEQTITINRSGSDTNINNTELAIETLNLRENNFIITVTAQDGVTKETYNLTIIKPSGENDVVNIKLQDANKGFMEVATKDNGFDNSDDHIYKYVVLDYSALSSFRLVIESSDNSIIDSGGSTGKNHTINAQFTNNGVEQSLPFVFHVIAENGKIQQHTIIISRVKADTNSLLESLTVDGNSVPGFVSGTAIYNETIVLNRTTRNVSILGVPQSDKATVEYYIGGTKYDTGSIPVELKQLYNIEIRVTPQGGQPRSYLIKVIAADESNDITNIKLSNIPEFQFQNGKREYVIDVPYSVKNTTPEVTASQNATISGNIPYLFESKNQITVIIYATSEAGIKGDEYTITINRADPRSFKDINSLILTPEGSSQLAQDVSKTVFNIRVDNNINYVMIDATILANMGASFTNGINKITMQYRLNLTSKDNRYIIKVYDEAGNEKEYTVNVKRANDNNEITSVTVDDVTYAITELPNRVLDLGSVPFSKSNFKITFAKEDETSVITTTPQLANNIWSITKTGESSFTFFSTSEAGRAGEIYTIKINRQVASINNQVEKIEIFADNGKTIVNLLEGVEIFTNKNLKLRIDRDVTEITIKIYLLAEHYSTINGYGTPVRDGKYNIYTRIENTLTIGNSNTYQFSVIAESTSIQANTYNINLISKNAINEIESFIIKNGDDVLHSTFTTHTLEELSFLTKSITVEIIKKDQYSVFKMDGVEHGKNEKTFTITIPITKDLQVFKFDTITEIGNLEANPNDYKIDTIEISIKRQKASDVVELESLSIVIDGVNIVDDFDTSKTLFEYRIDRQSTKSVDIKAVAKEFGTIEGDNGGRFLNFGENNYTFIVKSQDGKNTKQYKIIIIQANDDNTIDDIKVNGLDFVGTAFNEDELFYTLEDLLYSVKTINLEVLMKDSFATYKVTVNGKVVTDISKLELAYGENIIIVTGISEYKTVSSINYTITVNKDFPDEDVDLDDLTLIHTTSKVNIPFDVTYQKGTYSYIVTVADGLLITAVDIVPVIKPNSKQQIKGTITNIIINKNDKNEINQTLKFTVTAENNSIQEYTITLIRGNALSDDNGIDSVIVKDQYGHDYIDNFQEDKFDYTITVDFDVNKLTLEVNLKNKYAKLNVINNPTLIVGENLIKFTVKAENGDETQVYEIKVIRKAASNLNNLYKLEVETFIGATQGETHVFEDFGNLQEFELRIDREVSRINILAYILKDDKSTVLTFLPGVLVGELLMFANNGPIITQEGSSKIYNINIQSQSNAVKEHTLNVIRKNAIKDIEEDSVLVQYKELDNKLVTLYEGNFDSFDLGNIPYYITELQFSVTKVDRYSRLSYNGTKNTSTNNEVKFNVLLSNGLNVIKVVSETEVEDTHKDYESIIADFTYTKEVANKNTDLNDLIVKDQNDNILHFVEGAYIDGTYNYTIDYVTMKNVTSVNVLVTLKDHQSILGNPNLEGIIVTTTLENQVISFTIVAEDNTTQRYTVTLIKRPSTGGGSLSDNTNLKSMEVLLDDGLGGKDDIYPTGETNEYTYTLSYLFGGFHLLATPEDGNATITYNGVENKYFKLAYGESIVIDVIVTSSDLSEEKIYKVTVTRELAIEENELLSLEIIENGISENLSTSETYHEYFVDTDTNSIKIKAVAPDLGNIEGDEIFEREYQINSSKKVITIRVFAQNNEYKDYVIVIIKLDNDATLNLIRIESNGEEIKEIREVLNPDPNVDIVIDLKGTEFNKITSFNIIANANSKFAIVKGDGQQQLKAGAGATTESFKVVVTAQNGDTLEYTIIITREVDPEKDVTIEELTLTDVNALIYLGSTKYPNALNMFTSDKLDYTINVPYKLNALTLNIGNKFGATTLIKVNGIVSGTSIILNNKETIITFVLNSKDGSTFTEEYTINLIKDDADSNNLLEDILINGESIEGFDPLILNYEVKVPFKDNEQIDVEAILASNLSTLSGNVGSQIIKHGNNNITIRVTSESGVTKEYKVNIIALYDDVELLDLTVDNHDLDNQFEQQIVTYYLKLEPNVTSINVRVKSSPYSTVIGDVGLVYINSNKDELTYIVKSEYGTISSIVYKIIIGRREASTDTDLLDIIVYDKQGGTVIPFTHIGGKFKGDTRNVVDLGSDFNHLKEIYIEVKVDPTKNNTATKSGYLLLSGEISGESGNRFEVTVLAEDLKTTRTYEVYAFRNVNLSDEISINSFEFRGNDNINYLGTSKDALKPFTLNTKHYNIEVPYGVSTLMPKFGLSNNTKVSGDEAQTFGTLNVLEFRFVVMSQSGREEVTYTITVTRVKGSENNYLKDLTINGVTIEGFDPNIDNYQITLGRLDTKVDIRAFTQDSKATITGAGTKDLTTGINRFTITVTAESGDTHNYYIDIKIPSGDAFLSSLFIQDTEVKDQYIDFGFSEEIFEYDVILDKSIKSVYVHGIASDVSGASIAGQDRYEINNEGVTTIKIHVTSVNGDQQTYTLNITKSSKLSNDTKLDKLEIDGLKLVFDKDVNTYQGFSVSNKVTNLLVSANAQHKNAVVQVLNAENLTEGNNTITIKVTAEDGSVGYYLINVTRETQPDLFLTVLLILSIILWIITVLVLLIRTTRKDKKGNDELIY